MVSFPRSSARRLGREPGTAIILLHTKASFKGPPNNMQIVSACTGLVSLACRNPSPAPHPSTILPPLSPSAVDPPRITNQPDNRLNVIPGSVARFTVAASGLRLTYTWLQNGSALPSDGRFVAVNEMLTIRNVNVSDVGNYSCVVSNAAGSDTSDPARLTLSELCHVCVL